MNACILSARVTTLTAVATLTAPASAANSAMKTPATGLKGSFAGAPCELCAVCHSPLDRTQCDCPESAADETKKILFTTECNHKFHRVCLEKCREKNLGTCPMCRCPLPEGLTPEHVKEARKREQQVDEATAVRRAIVARSRRATEAVAAAQRRAIANRQAPPRPPAVSSASGNGPLVGDGALRSLVPPIVFEDEQGELQAQQNSPVGMGLSASAPTTPLRGGGGRRYPYPFLSAAETLAMQ